MSALSVLIKVIGGIIILRMIPGLVGETAYESTKGTVRGARDGLFGGIDIPFLITQNVSMDQTQIVLGVLFLVLGMVTLRSEDVEKREYVLMGIISVATIGILMFLRP